MGGCDYRGMAQGGFVGLFFVCVLFFCLFWGGGGEEVTMKLFYILIVTQFMC